ncbi:arginine--tRNA ligase [Arsenicicoccus dermatophilus]|uniref:arginine--tRNA ligase n=1 Tax=Arsenicicoccus dermatophilus TaxID=1076331 RepID=UPI001F4CA778|nr:arginine--tRNA ligase [Arsenicicoccus dermatophilus]MCH8613999.1 arginine--tRNA ligase [Arsenicicoccus dermatophilus]MCH8614321.1 arginine--tRNA ligase [Arsenicicoccus dermatophilus]
MVAPIEALTPAVQSALVAAFGEDVRGADPVLRPSQFADVQVNAAMALAKRLGQKPRDVAQAIVDHLATDGPVASAEVAGPGFVNITFADSWIAEQAQAAQADPRLGVATQEREIIPIDYSAPNVAKEMHVGHLRTTIIGDSLARTLEHLGHQVIRQNHVGDWGTPFGMLVEHLLEVGEDSPEAHVVETDPNAFYQAARVKFDDNEDFAVRARARVVRLQAGDPETLRLWGKLYDLSKSYFNRVYSTLGVTLTDADLAGESAYNDALPGICADLQAKGIATEDDGALVVFLPGFTGREDKPVPLFIRKSDGGYGYGTTDVATVKHRVEDLHADRILYVIGVTQSLHLQMVYETARRAGYLPEQVEVEHVKIGSVLGEDRKILKTRSGAPLRLMYLLDEAVQHARAYIDQARPELPEDERARIARQVGIGGVKYADLSVAHDSDYVFDLDRMLALTGNTGPYLQYATARIRSIFRTLMTDPAEQDAPIRLTEPAERELALKLLDFGGVVAQVGAVYEPHRLCTYLFELAQTFSSFYEQCPVLKADQEETKQSRLTLCALTLRTLVQGLDLLGVETPERM